MAATEFTCKDTQQNLGEAQLCKSEFRCSNCSQLQSELKEAKLESRSLKEIVNILSRDLASIGVRKHNLQELESSHIAAQTSVNC
jgi:hypothetical protein